MQTSDGRRPSIEHQSAVAEPNVFRSIWNHRSLMVVCVVAFAVLGLLVASLRPTDYAAEAGVVLKDPMSTALLGTPLGDELRYVADQVAILKSIAVAERASAVAKTAKNPSTISPRDLQRRISIRSSADSNYIIIRFTAGDPQTATTGANAMVRAYRDLIRADLSADTQAAIQKLDIAIEAAARTAARTSANQGAREAEALLSELRSRRTRLQVNAQLTGDGVALFSSAALGKAQGVSWISMLVIAVVLGGLIGAGAAYLVDERKQAFSSWLEPEAVLREPALAEIPDFTREHVSSKLPVLHAPGTESAEAFRFLASGVSSQAPTSKKGRSGGTGRQRDETGRFMPRTAQYHSVAFVSAAFGDGTTTLTANTALAAAQEGRRVLALDADVERQGLSQLLLGRAIAVDGDDAAAMGLSNMLRHRASPDTIQRVMGTGAGGTLSLLGPGTATRRRDDVFRSEQILSTLESIGDQFDLVLIDVPPILHVAYADALLRSAGSVVVVVRHKSEAARIKHVGERLDLLGVHTIGYVYNFAPSRQDLGRSVTKEVLDRAELVVGHARARAKKAVAQ